MGTVPGCSAVQSPVGKPFSMNPEITVNTCTVPPQAGAASLQEYADNESLNSLILDNLGIVSFVMQRLTPRLPRSIDRDDVRSAGILGLMDAATRFDPTRAVR